MTRDTQREAAQREQYGAWLDPDGDLIISDAQTSAVGPDDATLSPGSATLADFRSWVDVGSGVWLPARHTLADLRAAAALLQRGIDLLEALEEERTAEQINAAASLLAAHGYAVYGPGRAPGSGSATETVASVADVPSHTFNVGDAVQMLDPDGAYAERAEQTGVVLAVGGPPTCGTETITVRFTAGAGSGPVGLANLPVTSFEPWAPVVGERVQSRVLADGEDGAGVVVALCSPEAAGEPRVAVRFDSGFGSTGGGTWQRVADLVPERVTRG